MEISEWNETDVLARIAPIGDRFDEPIEKLPRSFRVVSQNIKRSTLSPHCIGDPMHGFRVDV
jgi:hypothetical protein